MAAKRLKGGSATGGTGDLKPQILTMSVGAGAVDDYRVAQVNLPTVRFGPSQNRATITEILKVWFYPGIEDTADVSSKQAMFIATTALGRASAETSTIVTIAADFLNTRIVAGVFMTSVLSTNGGWVAQYPQMVDLTDGNGNGVLVATDSLFIIGASVANTVAASFVAKVLYRMVNVGVQEYVGILQSQQ